MGKRKRLVKHNEYSNMRNNFISFDMKGNLPPSASEHDLIKYLIDMGEDLEGLDRRQRRIAKRIINSGEGVSQ